MRVPCKHIWKAIEPIKRGKGDYEIGPLVCKKCGAYPEKSTPNENEKTPEQIAEKIVKEWESDWMINPRKDRRKDTRWYEGYYPDIRPLIATAIRKERQTWEREKKELEAKNAELENFPHQLLNVNAICEERDRLMAEVQELREVLKPVKSDEEAIIEYLGNVTPDLKHDALKLCARIRAKERVRCARIAKSHKCNRPCYDKKGFIFCHKNIASAIRDQGKDDQ
jgi:hypothetical protein